jgi:2-amino-4-hydroxy-6-hydroxymethyldihydropteridine diphosphokinase
MNLARCLKELKLSHEIKLLNVSSVYQTEPYGIVDQPWFLNVCVEIETKLLPLELLKQTQQIDSRLGRKDNGRWGPRIIDIDILSYKGMIFKHPRLNIPHRQLQLRKFVLHPLKEIATAFIHPESKKNIDQMLNCCPDLLKVNWLMDGNELLTYLE